MIILITGGARSGKSRFAGTLADESGEPVVFVATATAGDDEMAARIAAHRRERPASWRTLELPLEVGKRLAPELGGAKTVIIDCLTLLLNNIFSRSLTPGGEVDAEKVEKDADAELESLLACLKGRETVFIIVTNEVGEGLVPANRLSRLYRDLLGKMNQSLAREADAVYLMVAGLPLQVKPPRF